MAFIAREDGEHFVIPSYRDVITAKQESALQKDILALSQSYGEYITLQRKAKLQFEIAFSPDQGYLLGETVWYKFNRPADMIFCEAIPNSNEAILVIVKNGSVYLDGSFQVDSIPEELVIFLTQQNNFEIFTSGDVPISSVNTEGKFSFDEGSVKSFTVLENPVFNDLPLIKAYRFQTVDAALKAQGIGSFPIKSIAGIIGVLVVAWFAFSTFTKVEEKKTQELPMEKNPYEAYVNALASPPPDELTKTYAALYGVLLNAPGWYPTKYDYKGGGFTSSMLTKSGTLETLMRWSAASGFSMTVGQKGVSLLSTPKVTSRPKPKTIYPAKEIIIRFVDRLQVIYPGYTNLSLAEGRGKGPYSNVKITIRFTKLSPQILLLIAKAMEGLPMTLESITSSVSGGRLNGSIVVMIYGT
jgi:hypothetical protein